MNEQEPVNETEEFPDAWWYRVYAAVMLFTVAVIALLWFFSRYFSG